MRHHAGSCLSVLSEVHRMSLEREVLTARLGGDGIEPFRTYPEKGLVQRVRAGRQWLLEHLGDLDG